MSQAPEGFGPPAVGQLDAPMELRYGTPMTTTEKLRQAQQAYLNADLTRNPDDWDEYYAYVQDYAWAADISLDDAYRTVENGPML